MRYTKQMQAARLAMHSKGSGNGKENIPSRRRNIASRPRKCISRERRRKKINKFVTGNRPARLRFGHSTIVEADWATLMNNAKLQASGVNSEEV
jgi:hypothetical protein